MINYYYATLKIETITKLKNFKTGSWVDVESPSTQEKKQLVDLGLDESLVDDAFDIHEVPRLEVNKGNFYFFARTPVKDPSQTNLPTAPVLIVIADKGVFSLSRRDLHSLWQPLLSDTSVATTQKTKLFILLVNQITGQYRDSLNLIYKKMRMVSTSLHNVNQKKIGELIEYERRLNDYLDSLGPMNEALENMLDGKGVRLYEDDREILEDLSLSFEQLMIRCRSMIKSITNIRDSYRIVLDSRLNDTIKLLTVITVCMTIPTMIAGIYGMNIKLPGNANHPAYFWGLLLGSFIFSLSFGIYFYKKR
jgi:magnesium transporter